MNGDDVRLSRTSPPQRTCWRLKRKLEIGTRATVADAQGGVSMKKIYPYKGFEITVELEPVRDLPRGVWSLTPQGFIAVVHVQAAGDSRDLLSPIRLMADG